MNVDVKNNIEKLETTFDITLNKEEFAPFLERAFKKEVKKVKADGFREGKMPKSVFIQKYGVEALFNEAINFAIAEAYANAITENQVKGVAFPQIDVKDVAEDKLHFSATVAVAPVLENVDTEKINVVEPSLEVTEEELEAALETFVASETELVVSETAAKLGDTVVIDFKGFVDGEAFEGGEGFSYPLELGSNSFIPGFEDQLVGAKAGEEVSVKVSFPENYQASNLAGKESVFECKVHEVKVKQTPKLDDEFVSTLGLEGVSTVAELKESKKAELATAKEANKDQALREAAIAAVDAYAAEIELNIHDNHVDEEVKAIISNFEQQNQIQFAEYAKVVGKTEEEVKEEIKSTAVESIKRRTILDFLAESNNFEATEEDVNAELQKLADMYQVDVELIRQSVAQELSQIKAMIRDQKVLDKLAA